MHIITCPIYIIGIFTHQGRKTIGLLHGVGKPTQRSQDVDLRPLV